VGASISSRNTIQALKIVVGMYTLVPMAALIADRISSCSPKPASSPLRGRARKTYPILSLDSME
jgi:hypothetical protein